ncbi:MAG: MBL fold metallo-hydrolase [Rhodothermales bacterium]|nr:MBL fold metallo-hydrolase [Rhodothermales bacterium]
MTRMGDYILRSIDAGTFGLDGGAMFGVIPKPLWERKIAADNRNRIRLAMRCLLVEGQDRLILIDNGIGTKFDEKFGHIYDVDTNSSSLEGSLHGAGLGLDDVTDVILTHLHFDHCGGSTMRSGDTLAVAFPNARFHVQVDHWRTANAPNPRERGSFLKENLAPLASSGQLVLCDGETELFPGVSVMTVDGHTEKMQLVKLEGGGKTLVYAADLLPTRFHLPAAWTMAYDVEPLVTIREKAAFLNSALEGNWHLFFEHDPEVEVGSVSMGERGPRVVDERRLDEL